MELFFQIAPCSGNYDPNLSSDAYDADFHLLVLNYPLMFFTNRIIDKSFEYNFIQNDVASVASETLLFCTTLKIWKAKSYSQIDTFCYTMFANWVRAKRAKIGCSRVWMSVVFHQIVANLPLNATEIVRFLKTLKFWGFLKTNTWVLRKKIFNF